MNCSALGLGIRDARVGVRRTSTESHTCMESCMDWRKLPNSELFFRLPHRCKQLLTSLWLVAIQAKHSMMTCFCFIEPNFVERV